MRSRSAGGDFGTVQMVPMRLVYDTRSHPLPEGVRAVLPRGRRLMFCAEDVELLVQVTPAPAPDSVRLMGQVWRGGVPISGASVRVDSAQASGDLSTDIVGQFRSADLPRGAYDMRIATGRRSFTVPTIVLDSVQPR